MRVAFSLIEGVSCALKASWEAGNKKDNETDVVTFISRPMWELFLAEVAEAVSFMPDESNGADTIRVYGSETVVFESEAVFAYSVPRALVPREDAA